KPARSWDEKTFMQALDDYDLVPQADPNTSSQTQRVLKYIGLATLAQQNPQIYDPIKIQTALIGNVLKIANPQQFYNPPEAMARPTPDQQEKTSEAQQRMQDSQAKLMLAKAKSDEVKAKTIQMMSSESRENKMVGLGGGQGGEQPQTPHEMSIDAMNAEATLMDAHSRAKEVDQKRADILLQDANAQEERQSKQKIALLEMAKDAMEKRADMQIQQSEHQDAMRMDH